MPINALNAVALLYRMEPDGGMSFLGSCFSLRHATHFLTAAHCVHQLIPGQVTVVSHLDQSIRKVTKVVRHEEADIAILEVESIGDDSVESFWNCVGNYSLGEEYFAFGFPEDSLGPNEGRPTPRLFKGYFHRFMPHQSHMGYQYIAGELSTPCPGGLSGAPLFRPGPPQWSRVSSLKISKVLLFLIRKSRSWRMAKFSTSTIAQSSTLGSPLCSNQ